MVWRTPASRLLVPIARRLIAPVFPRWFQRFERRNCQAINALEDISFELKNGGSLGIIGLNGSGKSTLLQIIAGTLVPTSGTVEVEGRVAALLELGSGFDPEFTGRENVYLNAAILGLTRKQVDERFDSIVSFADIGDFIDRPVKTYSSGMMVRLAFAVQVHVDPDILIVDEALAVGDAKFQAKALSKIEAILAGGTSLLFVGHDLGTVRAFCDEALLLSRGKVVERGLPDDVTVTYLHHIQMDRLTSQSVDGFNGESESAPKSPMSEGRIAEAQFDGIGRHATLRYDEHLPITIKIELSDSIGHPYLIFELVDMKGLQLTGKRIQLPTGRVDVTLKLSLTCRFQKGVYRFRMRIVDAPTLETTRSVSRQDDLLSLEMLEDMRNLFTGLFPVPLNVEIQD